MSNGNRKLTRAQGQTRRKLEADEERDLYFDSVAISQMKASSQNDLDRRTVKDLLAEALPQKALVIRKTNA